LLVMQCSLRVIPRRFNAIHSVAPRFFSAKAEGAVEVNRTQLDNGVTIISGAKKGDSLASAGVYVQAGSAFESHSNHGCAHYLRRFLFKSTNRVSGLRMTRTIESITASFTATNTPEVLAYTALFPHEHTGNAMALMSDVLRPRLAEWEFRDVRNLVRHDVNERKSNKEENILDVVRHTAYGGVGLGRSPLCSEHNVNQIYPEHVAEYILNRVIGKNITVVGNVNDHEKFVEVTAKYFGAFSKDPETSGIEVDASEYIGGTQLVCDGPGSAYAEAYKGVASCTTSAFAQEILAEILGFYSPGRVSPTDRRTSRLGKTLGKTNVSQAASFILNDSQTVFGVQALGDVPCRELAEIVHAQLTGLASNITEEEFITARNIVSAKSRFLNERRENVLDTVARFNFSDNSEFSEVTIDDVRNVAKKILESKPTVYASGDLAKLPSFAF